MSTITTSREKAVVAKTCLLNPLGRLDVYRTNLQLFIPALCPSGLMEGHNFANWQAQAAFWDQLDQRGLPPVPNENATSLYVLICECDGDRFEAPRW